MKTTLLNASQPPSSKLPEPSIPLPVYMLGANHVQLDHFMGQGLSKTNATHPSHVHTRVIPRFTFEMVHALAQVANDMPAAPKKTAHFAATELTVIPNSNLNSEPVPAPENATGSPG